jgi:hypothetical protein
MTDPGTTQTPAARMEGGFTIYGGGGRSARRAARLDILRAIQSE